MRNKKNVIIFLQVTTIILLVYVAFKVSFIGNPPIEIAPIDFTESVEKQGDVI